jgi:hypothetical protein
MTLLEEPQAALYSWIQKSEGGWRKQVQVGDLILWWTSAAARPTCR